MYVTIYSRSNACVPTRKPTTATFSAWSLAALTPLFALTAGCDTGPGARAPVPSVRGGSENKFPPLPPSWTAPAEFDCNTAAPTKKSDVAGKPGGFWPGMLVDCVSGENREVLGLISQDGRFRIISMWEDRSDLLSGRLEMDGDTFSSIGKSFISDQTGCTACSATSLFVTGFVSDRQHLEGHWSADWGGYGYFVMEYDGIVYENRTIDLPWSTSLEGIWDGARDDHGPTGTSWTIDSSGQITGSDDSGCAYAGAYVIADSNYSLLEVQVTLSGCEGQGTYTGFATKTSGPFNDRLWVSIDNGEQHAIRLFFFSR